MRSRAGVETRARDTYTGPSNALDDRGDPLSAADAHRDERVAPTDVRKLVHRLDRQDDADCADRMAKCDSAAVRIHFLRIEAEFLADGERLCGECLVRFDDVDIGETQARLRERALHRADRTESHVLRVDARVTVGDETGQRLQALLFGGASFHQDHGCGRVVDAGCLAGRHRAVLFDEHSLQFRHALGGHVAAYVLVGVELDRTLSALELDRQYLALEAAFRNRRSGALMTFGGERVLLLAGDLALL